MPLTAPADLSTVRTWPEFTACLRRIHLHTGMSYSQMQKAAEARAEKNRRFRELKRSTVSDALNANRRVDRELLESLLAVWNVTVDQRNSVVEAWSRVSATTGRGPANARRVDEVLPRELGIHAAIAVDDSREDLPRYVERGFDERLRGIIGNGASRGCFVLLFGNSSTGKTRSLYEAIHNVVPDWWIVQPSETREIVELSNSPTERTILWLDELNRFLGTDPPLTKAIISKLIGAQAIVVGTMWSEDYFAHRKPRRSDGGHGLSTDERLLLSLAETVPVNDDLTEDERETAVGLAASDSRLRIALESTDTGLTQVLAAGPDLVHLWQQAPDPYAKAIITAAADARRLGVHSPLPENVLCEAMEGYLTPHQRVTPPEEWLALARPHATVRLHGAVSALTPVAVTRAGTVDGYVIADYLAQHIRRVRRSECPPDSLWSALAVHVGNPDDLRRLALAAQTRLRYSYAEQALRRLGSTSHSAALDLAALMVRQDRFDEAITVLSKQWTSAQSAAACARRLTEIVALRSRVHALRSLAQPHAAARLAEILADGGAADDLRSRALGGDMLAAEQLSDLLAERGCLEELREGADAGYRFAGERLAELLAGHGRIEELRERAQAGDPTSTRELIRLDTLDDGRDPIGRPRAAEIDQPVLNALRRGADAGDLRAAERLTTLLFDLHQRAALLIELNAGTAGAADRYLALLTIEEDANRGHVDQVRAFGLRANGDPADPPRPR